MAAVGKAAARGEDPPAKVLARLERLAKAQPLSAEPLLIHGAIALRHGNVGRAERLLTAARQREPRDPAARYLLADLYLRTGRPLPAMAEMSVLNRLLPRGAVQLAPALAAYATTADAAGELSAIVSAYPELKAALLDELAKNAANADLVLSIAGGTRGDDAEGEWKQKLTEVLVSAGQFARARAVWERLSGATVPGAGLFNPRFDASDAPPPFNWQLASSAAGVADPNSGGLDILYYGRTDVDLAAQTLLLPPGGYRLAMNVSGDVGQPGSLRWTVACVGIDERLLDLPLPADGGTRAVAGAFAVPEGCEAQTLRLSALGQEFPKQAQFRISGLQLARAGSR